MKIESVEDKPEYCSRFIVHVTRITLRNGIFFLDEKKITQESVANDGRH